MLDFFFMVWFLGFVVMDDGVGLELNVKVWKFGKLYSKSSVVFVMVFCVI